jgi:hypothetical protein
MPTAVLSSLLAGICGVVEIHYNLDYSREINWTEKWAMVTVIFDSGHNLAIIKSVWNYLKSNIGTHGTISKKLN